MSYNAVRKRKIIIIYVGTGLILSVLYWIIDSLIDFTFVDEIFRFYLTSGPLTFLDALFTDVSPWDLLDRVLFILIMMSSSIFLTFLSLKRLKAESDFRSSADLFKTLVENIPLIIYQKDVKGRYKYVNEHFLNIEGLSSKEVIGNTDFQLFPNDEAEKFTLEDQEILSSKIKIDKEVYYPIDGQIRTYHLVKTPILKEKKQSDGILGILQDITDQKQRQIELIRSQKLESLSYLAGGLAHDFNNILTGIMGYVELLKLDMYSAQNNNLTQKIKDRVEKIGEATDKAKNISRQIMTFAKGDKPQTKIINIYNLVKKTADLIFHGKKSRYFLESIPAQLKINADPTQISQAISNLLINAIQSMPDGGDVSIKITQINRNNKEMPENNLAISYVKIEITDFGIGIPEELQNQIFNPYFTTKSEGTGLGLSMTHRIIQNHMGYITFKSKINKGTTFEILLPLSEEKIKDFTQIPQQGVQLNLSILLMDDEPNIQNVTSLLLRKLGCKVDITKEGIETIEKYRNSMKNGNKYDCVILDLTIPGGKGGKETFDDLRDIDQNVIGIVSSGYFQDPIIANFKNYGFKGALQKPYTYDELKSILLRIFKNKNEYPK